MKRSLIAFALILSLCLSGCMLLQKEHEIVPIKPAPQPQVADFTALDAQGNEVALYDFIGKPIVLNFWATWCGPCMREMPEFQQAYLDYQDQVQFVMVNMTDGAYETVEGVQAFLQEQGYTFPVLFDTQAQAATVYQVYSIPTTCFISADGQLVSRKVGTLSAQALQTGIDSILPQ